MNTQAGARPSRAGASPSRAGARETFLQAHGWADAARYPLANDASFRAYVRLHRADGEQMMLMDAPPPVEDVRPFVMMAAHLRELGYSAPEVRAVDADNGFLLLEDLGDRTFTRELAAGADEQTLYGMAMALLTDLHDRPRDQVLPAALPTYDRQFLMDEADLLLEWYGPTVWGHPADATRWRQWRDLWRPLAARAADAPKTLVLRDFHVDNLIRLPERDGLAQCGLLDFQGALAGPAAYDVMSLLEDARRDVDPDLAQSLLRRYVNGLPPSERDEFMTVYNILAAQRHAKVIGIFTRLLRRDGKAGYLTHIPRVWRMLARALQHPVLHPLGQWVDQHFPADTRTVPR